MVPCPSLPWPMNPLQGSGVSARSRCGAVRILELADEPSTGIACRSALAVVPCESSLPGVADEPLSYRDRACRIALPDRLPANPLRSGIGRVGALSLWCRANP